MKDRGEAHRCNGRFRQWHGQWFALGPMARVSMDLLPGIPLCELTAHRSILAGDAGITQAGARGRAPKKEEAMKFFLAVLSVGLFLGLAPCADAQSNNRSQAQSGRTYDPQTGNTYNWRRNSDGSTTVRGSNLQTGSTWTNRVESNGNQRGTDSDGNMWRYNATTGTYTNTNGRICTGRGAYRTCSGGPN